MVTDCHVRSPPTSNVTISSGTALKHELKRELQRLPRYLTDACMCILTHIYIYIKHDREATYLSNDADYVSRIDI